MAESENLKQLKRILSRTADLIREAEGSSEPVQVSDMRQKVATMDIATFNIDNNHVLKGHTVVNGTTDPSTPADTTDYYRKLLTNFANKVRVGSEKLNIDQIEEQENLVCGVHKVHPGPGAPVYSLTIPDGVTSIGNKAFWSCGSLRSITIPDSVTSIGDEAFRNCMALVSITIPDSVTSIGVRTFNDCWDLVSITIPDSITHIGAWSFKDCKKLTELTIPKDIIDIESGAFRVGERDNFELYFDGTMNELKAKNFDWVNEIDDEFSIVNSSVRYIHCLDGDYDIRSGGGSGSGSGSGSGDSY